MPPSADLTTIFPVTRESSWTKRAFAGVTRANVALMVALCAIFGYSLTAHDTVNAWDEGVLLEWLVYDVLNHIGYMVVIAAVMAPPILIVANLGPQSGWRRWLALAAVIAAVTPLGVLVRVGDLVWIGEWNRWDQDLGLWLRLSIRCALQAALLVVVAEFHRYETRSVEAMHRAEIDRLALDREMAEARMQVMRAQIEPHFLFNTLANVRRLYQTDRAAGRTMLEHLKRYLEIALPRMRDSRSTLGGELALIEAYLNVQRIRMGRRLAFAIDLPASLHPLAVPPMMLLTLVENAIKHGLNPLPEGGSIRIRAKRDGARLQVTVVDDGRGFQASSGGGTGLANIRARLTAEYGDAASLELAENEPRGVSATLGLPALEPGGDRV